MDAALLNSPAAAGRYAFEDFRLDVPSRVLWREGVGAVPLPSRAFDTLVYLIERRDRLVRKNELVDAVWADVVVTDDSLIHAISVLRRALADDPNHPRYVQTIPRRGYRFIAAVTVPDAAPAASARDDAPAAGAARPGPPRSAFRFVGRRALGAAGMVTAAVAIAVVALAVAGALAIKGAATPELSGAGESGNRADVADVRSAVSPPRAVRLSQPAPPGAAIVSGGVLSPDGESLTFVARDDASGTTALWVRALHSAGLKRLDETEGAAKPFWSPDSSRVGFFTNGDLKTIDVRDGAVQIIASVGLGAAGGAWSPDGTILFADWTRGLYTVAYPGAHSGAHSRSEPSLVAALDRSERDIAVAWPQFLPDGRRFLYQVVSLDASRTGVHIGDLDTRRSARVLETESPAVFAPPRHLLHVQHDLLIAEEFDPSTRELTGRATLLARGVSPPSLANDDTFSAAGDLVAYRHGVRQQQLAWVDRAGKVLTTLPMPAVMFNPRVSPDGSRLLATSSVTTNPGLWLASLSRHEFERLETDAIAPLWSPDGARIAFTARGGADLLIRPSKGADTRRLLSDPAVKILNDWSFEGDHIIYSQSAEETQLDLWGVRVGDGATFPILATAHNELQARLSPDGRWLAYVADDSGALEVYAQRYPELGKRYRISEGGGGQPQWRGDQREIYYIAPDRTLVAVSVGDDPRDPFGAPRRLFRAPVTGGPNDARDYYAAAPDGTRFLLDGAFRDGGDSAITVVVNWPAETGKAALSSARSIE